MAALLGDGHLRETLRVDSVMNWGGFLDPWLRSHPRTAIALVLGLAVLSLLVLVADSHAPLVLYQTF
jgi:hypothetical protein